MNRRFSISIFFFTLALVILSFGSFGLQATPTPPSEFPGEELYFQYPNMTSTSVNAVEMRLWELGYRICMVSSNFYLQTESVMRYF